MWFMKDSSLSPPFPSSSPFLSVSFPFLLSSYVIVLFSLFHLNALVLVATPTAIDAGVLLLFYGMYYGVLCRDIAEICSDRMASRIGYYRCPSCSNRKLEKAQIFLLKILMKTFL